MASGSGHMNQMSRVTHSINKVDDFEDPLSDFVVVSVHLVIL